LQLPYVSWGRRGSPAQKPGRPCITPLRKGLRVYPNFVRPGRFVGQLRAVVLRFWDIPFDNAAELRNAVRTPLLLGPVTVRLGRLPRATSGRSRGFNSRLTRPCLGRCPNFFPKVSNAGVDSSYHLCYHLLQRRGAAGGPGAAKTKPHGLKSQSDSNGLATLNGPTGSSPGSDACGDPSGGGTASGRSTSHGSMKQEAAGRLFHPRRVK
jgi:hypothetical protein